MTIFFTTGMTVIQDTSCTALRMHVLHLRNAERDFALSEIERDIIEKHMFPVNIKPPRHKESYIVTIADKICALREVITFKALALRIFTISLSRTAMFRGFALQNRRR